MDGQRQKVDLLKYILSFMIIYMTTLRLLRFTITDTCSNCIQRYNCFINKDVDSVNVNYF